MRSEQNFPSTPPHTRFNNLSPITKTSVLTSSLKEIIWQVVAAIPYGKVATYGQVAKLCGFPRHARYVGMTLRDLPNGSTLPWHRVINAKGEIAFPRGSDAYTRQQTRLRAEGVVFKHDRLPLGVYRWSP